MNVSLFGDLPLYQSREFEAAIERWVRLTLKQREIDFAKKFEVVEQAILSQF